MMKGNESVYPIVVTGPMCEVHEGLTKRELFAAMAMQGILMQEQSATVLSDDEIAAAAVRQADALIKELGK